jgi:hypothetical protein
VKTDSTKSSLNVDDTMKVEQRRPGAERRRGSRVPVRPPEDRGRQAGLDQHIGEASERRHILPAGYPMAQHEQHHDLVSEEGADNAERLPNWNRHPQELPERIPAKYKQELVEYQHDTEDRG